jgi:hypothetical protein
MKVDWSGIGIVGGSGKLGGSVVGRGRSGPFARIRVKPTNPRTNTQVSQRSKLSTRAQAWRGLTSTQIAAWNAAADSGEWPLKNSMGRTFQPTGSQLYNQLNLNLSKIGATAITTPPTKEALPAVLLGTLTAAAGTPALSVAFSGTLGTGYSLAVYAAPQTSPGISRPGRSKFRYLTTYASTTPANILSSYNTLFGTLVAGQKVFIYAEVVSETSGQTALAGQAVATVSA